MQLPEYIHIETKRTCNRRCSVCTVPSWEPIYELPLQIIEDIAQEIYASKRNHTVRFGYRSEFLTDPRCIQIGNLFKQQHVLIVTNGDNILQYIENGGYVNTIVFSVLGGLKGEYSYENVTGVPFEKLKLIISQIPQSYNISLAVNTVTPEDTIAVCNELKEYINSSIIIYPMLLPNDTFESYSNRTKWFGITSIIKQMIGVGIIENITGTMTNNNCMYSSNSVFINAEGNIDACCFHEGYHNIAKYESSLKHTLANPLLINFRTKVKRGKLPSQLCIQNPRCGGILK